MPHSDHFIHTNHHYKLALLKKRPSNFDILISIISVVYPLSALPQAIEVFKGNNEGVALSSWVLFGVCATLFLMYGVKHRVFPMIISNTLWIIMDAAVIIGLILSI